MRAHRDLMSDQMLKTLNFSVSEVQHPYFMDNDMLFAVVLTV